MNREHNLRTALDRELQPVELRVTNESSQHNVPPGSETHFRVLIVSERFASQNRLARHRSVHRAVGDELAKGLHALAIDAWTPAEWAQREQPSQSPECRGGSAAEARRASSE